MKVFTEVTLNPAAGGFGQWERGEKHVSPEGSYALLSDLELEGQLIPLESALADPEFIAAGIRDIRGLIRNQPTLIYARLSAGELGWVVDYVGVETSEVPEDFWS